MPYQTEPPYQHGRPPGSKAAQAAILLCNLGTPAAPHARALRTYLAEFLSDPRVVEIPRLIWWFILHGIILRLRPARSAAKYASIWSPEGSPLWVWTRKQAQSLEEQLQQQGHQVRVWPAMRYGQPSMARQLDAIKQAGIQRVLVLPLYPQYAAATTASLFDALAQWGQKTRLLPEWRWVNRYHDHPLYIHALAQRVRQHWAQHGQGEKLLLSFHGLPKRSLMLGDPYHCECLKTARLLREALNYPPERFHVSFQSRFGRAQWLEPYTEPTLVELARQGTKRVDVFCPGFTSDCLETLEEIRLEARTAFLMAGGEAFQTIDCLNDHPDWLAALTQIALQHMQGWNTLEDPHNPQNLKALGEQAERALKAGAPA
jgi:ferrochelatase